ncbi:hypothetical protein MKW92_001029 [Papaver armeniacum]|nr:hypothetical protein MKW92_001029 [Papaver armeniacum]
MANASISNTILKHYSPSSTSSSVDEQSVNMPTHEIVPLTIFDKATHDCHEDVYLVFKPPMPPNEVLKDALSKVLVHYPHLAGRFITDNLGRSCIILNNAGVRITETFNPTTLAEQLPFDMSKDSRHLLPPVKGVEELCRVQLNRYACGGLILSFTSHHRVADGQSILGSFMVSWSRMCLDIELLPHHDRLVVCQPRNPPRVEFDHGSIEFKKTRNINRYMPTTINLNSTPVISSSLETVIINYSAEFINKLKVMVNNNPYERCSTFALTQVRGLGLEESSQVRIAEYFGNLVLWAYPRLKVKELLNESHAYIAKAIRDEVNCVNDRYFKSFIDFGSTIYQGNGDDLKSEELQQTTPEFGSTLCPNLEVDSWLGFPVDGIDFGSGSPCAIMHPSTPFEGLVIFIPAGTEDGGVDVKVTLFTKHVTLFKKIAHSIDEKLNHGTLFKKIAHSINNRLTQAEIAI